MDGKEKDEPTFATTADQIDGSERAALARRQIYGLQKHFILKVDAARSPRGTDWPEVNNIHINHILMKQKL